MQLPVSPVARSLNNSLFVLLLTNIPNDGLLSVFRKGLLKI